MPNSSPPPWNNDELTAATARSEQLFKTIKLLANFLTFWKEDWVCQTQEEG